MPLDSTLRQCTLNELATLMTDPEASHRLRVYHTVFLSCLGVDPEMLVQLLTKHPTLSGWKKSSVVRRLDQALMCAERHSSK
jgi:hypothetical protein